MKNKEGNFKVRALESKELFVEKGKIYEFKNGRTIWCDGISSDYYDGFEDLIITLPKLKGKLEEVKDNPNESIIIYRKNNEVVALHKRDGKVIKTAKAICCEDDEFNFKTGADLVYKRLMSKDKKVEKQKEIKEEKYLRLESIYDSASYGKVGESTIYKDDFGRPLFVGDKVLTINKEGDTYTNFIVDKESEKEMFIMGMRCDCNQNTGVIREHKVIKIQDFSKLKEGDSIIPIKCVLK